MPCRAVLATWSPFGVGAGEDQLNHRRELGPAQVSCGQALTSSLSNAEVLSARAAFAGMPFAGDQAVLLKPGRQRIDRAALEVEDAGLRQRLDQRIAIAGSSGLQRREHREVQNAAQPLSLTIGDRTVFLGHH